MRSLLIAVLLGCSASCGSSTTTHQCMPMCPSGTECTAAGCVVGGGSEDLSLSGASASDQSIPCGGCSGATPFCAPSGQCVPCLVSTDCPLGSICQALGATFICSPGCTDDTRCSGGAHCCGGECVDLMTDGANCGACKTSCVSAHAGASCAGGSCVAGTCAAGWGDCNHDDRDGCETNTNVDATSCGSCGVSCTVQNGKGACAGSCYIRSCNFGWDDCDVTEANGCETAVLSDVRNCGACGASCPSAAHAMVACANAACVVSACTNGFLDCDGRFDNGCETSGVADATNCGACGNTCAKGLVCRGSQCTCPNCNFPNASARCVNNNCIIGKCDPGFGDCDGDTKNGCETSTVDDPNNCGACGNVCPPNAAVCLNGMCTDSPCIGNPDWQRVTCTTGDWVWSRDRGLAMSVKDAAANRVLATGCKHATPQPDEGNGLCSLDGTGWVSTKTFVMADCDAKWYHLGGRFSGNCGGHNGDTWRHLVLTDNDCYPY